jgi:hypothetical protein
MWLLAWISKLKEYAVDSLGKWSVAFSNLEMQSGVEEG